MYIVSVNNEALIIGRTNKRKDIDTVVLLKAC